MPHDRYEKVEAGELMPEPDELAAISRITGRSVDFLVTGGAPPARPTRTRIWRVAAMLAIAVATV